MNYKEGIGKFFTTNGQDIWKLVAYTDTPIACFKNIETEDVKALCIDSIDIKKFKRLKEAD